MTCCFGILQTISVLFLQVYDDRPELRNSGKLSEELTIRKLKEGLYNFQNSPSNLIMINSKYKDEPWFTPPKSPPKPSIPPSAGSNSVPAGSMNSKGAF